MERLTARRILNEGWSLVTENFWQVVSIAFFPIIVAFLMLIFAPHEHFGHPWALTIEHGVNALMAVFFAVAWLRFVQTRDRHKGVTMFRFGSREIKYLIAYLVFWLLPYLVTIFFVKEAYGHSALILMSATDFRHLMYVFGWWMLLVAIYYCCALKWILMFPAIADGKNIDPTTSWRQTNKRWWLIIRTFVSFAIWYTVIVYGTVAFLGIVVNGWGILVEPVESIRFLAAHRGGGLFFEWGSLTVGILVEYCLWAWFLSIPGVLYKHLKDAG